MYLNGGKGFVFGRNNRVQVHIKSGIMGRSCSLRSLPEVSWCWFANSNLCNFT